MSKEEHVWIEKDGAKYYPWGTPQVTVCVRDLALLKEMFSVLLVR